MEVVAIEYLFILLGLLIIFSSIFSASETALLSLNKYKLSHQAKNGNKSAIKAISLLKELDRLIGLILLGNNFFNILASSIATYLAIELFGNAAVALAAGILTIIILIFAEVAPKTLASLYPEAIAFPMVHVLSPLLKISYPVVYLVNMIANGTLRIFGVKVRNNSKKDSLNQEELKSLIEDSTDFLPEDFRTLLGGVLQLNEISVEDVMIPKQEIEAINFDNDLKDIINVINKSNYSRLPIYDKEIENIIGVLKVKDVLTVLHNKKLSKQNLKELAINPLFVPETTNLKQQLANFHINKQEIALIIDEYGSLRGLLTMEDLLEEIIGNLYLNQAEIQNKINAKIDDNDYIEVDGVAFIRDINRAFNIHLPVNGPKTINGLIQEELESIPTSGQCIKIGGYILEVLQSDDHQITRVRLKELEKEDMQLTLNLES